jgi:hypothetical protein
LQGCWFLLHFTAWILYAAFVHSVEASDVVWRVWIPVVVPVLSLPPLLAFLHWSLYAAHLYTATHAHPDMQRLESRLRCVSYIIQEYQKNIALIIVGNVVHQE